jgi:hypothetical protein
VESEKNESEMKELLSGLYVRVFDASAIKKICYEYETLFPNAR